MAHDVELLLIGDCLVQESRLDDVTVTGDDFANPVYANIFDRMLDRHRLGLGVSQVLLADDFPAHMDVIWNATNWSPETGRTEAHDRAVQTASTRRKLKAAAQNISTWADDSPIENLVDTCRAEVDKAMVDQGQVVTSMRDDVHATLAAHRTVESAYPSPWPSLNEIIRGFIGGRLYIIGARPAVGKSAFAQQLAYELASHGSVIFSTMEMEKAEVYERIIAQQAQIYYGGMSSGNASPALVAKEKAWLETQSRDLIVLDSGTQTVASIRTAARTAQRAGKLAAIVVDYIHLLSTGRKDESEVARLGELTRALKTLAMDLKVPVIALSQLNRAVASRNGGKPGLADLRGSGSIEQDGDVAIFLWKATDPEGNVTQTEELNVFIAKNRQGPAFVDLHLHWQGDFVRAMEFPS
jgi:replicative DNA helicase